MKKSNLLKLSDVIREYLEVNGLDDKLIKYSIKNRWEELAGPRIAPHTRNLHFTSDGRLRIEFNSDAARHEASFVKEELLKKINDFAGKEILKDVILA